MAPPLRPFLLLLLGLAGVGRGQMYSNVEIEVDSALHEQQFFTFLSRPDIDAPRWAVRTHNRSALAPGYWFVSPYGKVKQDNNDKRYVAPAIYADDGELVWNGGPDFHYFDTFSFQVSRFAGRDVLTLLHPRGSQGVIMNEKYEVDRHERAGLDGTTTNMHEFQLVEDGHRALYMTTFVRKASRENSARVAFDGQCNTAFIGFQERKTGNEEITFDWVSEPHIPLNESYRFRDGDLSKDHKGPTVQHVCANADFDYIHLNSVEKLADGDFLLSGRDAYTLYKISHLDGSIVWRLGGKQSDFTFEGGTRLFTGQHDARCLMENSTHMLISVMDNALGTSETDVGCQNSRGLVMSVDLEARTVREVMAYNHPHGPGGYAREGGNFQTLPNGNAFLSWQTSGLLSEYSPDGTVVSEAYLLSGLKTYRNFKFPWVGSPRRLPDVHSQVMEVDGVVTTVVHTSWNGATEVRRWRLYETDADGAASKMLNSTARTGFETAITYRGFAPYVRVDALGPNDEELPRSQSHVYRTIALPAADGSHLLIPHRWLGKVRFLFTNPIVAFFAGLLFYKAITVCCRGRGKRAYPWRKHRLYDMDENVEGDALLEKGNQHEDARTLHQD